MIKNAAAVSTNRGAFRRSKRVHPQRIGYSPREERRHPRCKRPILKKDLQFCARREKQKIMREKEQKREREN